MKWIYLAAGIALFIKMLVFPNPVIDDTDLEIVASVVQDSGVPNAVAGIIFRNRLYDTIFEVIVFTISIMGVRFLLADEQAFSHNPSIYRCSLDCSRSIRRDDCSPY